jgi:hypothetical protein
VSSTPGDSAVHATDPSAHRMRFTDDAVLFADAAIRSPLTGSTDAQPRLCTGAVQTGLAGAFGANREMPFLWLAPSATAIDPSANTARGAIEPFSRCVTAPVCSDASTTSPNPSSYTRLPPAPCAVGVVKIPGISGTSYGVEMLGQFGPHVDGHGKLGIQFEHPALEYSSGHPEAASPGDVAEALRASAHAAHTRAAPATQRIHPAICTPWGARIRFVRSRGGAGRR